MYCLRCGKEIPDHSIFCLFCGEKLPAVSESKAEPETAPEVKENVCIVCGSALSKEDSVCPVCEFPVISLLHGSEEETAKITAIAAEYRIKYEAEQKKNLLAQEVISSLKAVLKEKESSVLPEAPKTAVRQDDSLQREVEAAMKIMLEKKAKGQVSSGAQPARGKVNVFQPAAQNDILFVPCTVNVSCKSLDLNILLYLNGMFIGEKTDKPLSVSLKSDKRFNEIAVRNKKVGDIYENSVCRFEAKPGETIDISCKLKIHWNRPATVVYDIKRRLF